MTDRSRAHLRISGRVQGVFFRKTSQQKAKSYILTGWVMNRSDGTVEAVVEGDRENIEKFIDWCHEGPSRARVDNVDVTWEEYKGEFDQYQIRYE